MTSTPYDIIRSRSALQDDRSFLYSRRTRRQINHLFPGDFQETSRKQKQFLTQFLGGPNLYTAEHGHQCLRSDT